MTATTTNAFTIKVTVTGTVASPNGTTVPSATSITDTQGNVWTLSGGIIYIGKTEQTSTHGVTLLLWYAGAVWQQTSLGFWEALSVANSVAVWGGVTTDPRPATPPSTPPPVTGQGVALGAYLTTYPTGSGSNYYSSLAAHLAGFTAALGQAPAIMGGAICANAAAYYTPCTPDQWPGTVSSQTSAMSVVPTSMPLMLTWCWQNNSGLSLYNDMAGVTNTLYAGQPISYWVQQTLGAWKAAGRTTLYLRPNWEWNINQAWAQDAAAAGVSAATFVKAFQNFYTTCKQYAAANGMTIYVVWNPSVYGQTDQSGDTLASQFPNQKTGDAFCDVICADFYAESGQLATAAGGGASTWSLANLVSLAQTWNLPIGFCELGGLKYPSGGASAATTWIPNFVSYIAGLSVKCAFAMLWDVNTGLDATSNLEFTAPGANQSAIVAAWKAALGPSGTLR